MQIYNPYLEDDINAAYNEMQDYISQQFIQKPIGNVDELVLPKLPSVINKDGEIVELRKWNSDVKNLSHLVYQIYNAEDTKIGVIHLSIINTREIMIENIAISYSYANSGYCQSLLRVLISELVKDKFSILKAKTDSKNEVFDHILEKYGFKPANGIMEIDLPEFDSSKFMREAKIFYLDAITEAGKEGVYKENYIFRDKLQKAVVSPVLSKESSRDAIIDFVGEFIDRHNRELSTPGPVFTFTFGTKQLEPIYELFNISDTKLIELYMDMVEDTYGGKISKFFGGWVKAAPHKILINAIMAESVQKGYDDVLECCEYMYAFTEYPILYRKYWSTGVKEEVMNYTIEHLGSKYKIKHCKTILELLKYDADVATKAFIDKLKTAEDNVYMDLIYRMRTQFNSKLRNINNQYYENSKKDLSQHTNVIQFDDGEMADQEGHSSNVAQIINKTVSKFASAEINNAFLKISAEKNQIDKANLNNFIAQIFSTKNNNIPRFIDIVITHFFTKNPKNTGISPTEFLNFGLTLYRSIGTSKDPSLQELKKIVNVQWMNEIIDIRSQYKRDATVIAYTRGVYDYMIFMINYYNN